MLWFRGGIAIFIILTVIYFLLSLYSRWKCKQRLAAEFDEGNIAGDRDLYIQAGLIEYENSLRYKLLLGVYIIPIIVVSALIYINNFM